MGAQELLLNLVAKPHSTTAVRQYNASPQSKWKLFRSLSEWKFLHALIKQVTRVDKGDEHISGSADVILELLDRLAADDNGSLLLQPIGHIPEVLNSLTRTVLDESCSQIQRSSAQHVLLGILVKSSAAKVAGPPTSPYQSFGSMMVNYVPNQMSSLCDEVHRLVEQEMDPVIEFLIREYKEEQRIHMSED